MVGVEVEACHTASAIVIEEAGHADFLAVLEVLSIRDIVMATPDSETLEALHVCLEYSACLLANDSTIFAVDVAGHFFDRDFHFVRPLD